MDPHRPPPADKALTRDQGTPEGVQFDVLTDTAIGDLFDWASFENPIRKFQHLVRLFNT